MKRPLFAAVLILLLIIPVMGCGEKEAPVSPPKETVTPEETTPPAEQVAISTCITCHTDKNTLQKLASAEPAEIKSEATSGEG